MGNDDYENELKESVDDIIETPGGPGMQIPKALKDMPQEMWTKSFFDAANIVRKQRHKAKQIKITPIKKKKSLLPKIKKKSKNKITFASTNELKRSPVKEEGNETTIAKQENDIFADTPIKRNKNLKFAQFIPKHLVDFDERELVKIKRTMMGEHVPILKVLSSRLRYLRQMKSLWKKKRTNDFMKLLQTIQKDDACGTNTLFLTFIQCILKNVNTKSFSFRFCYQLLAVIDLFKLDMNKHNEIIVILEYVEFLLDTFSEFIRSTLSMENVNAKDLSMMDRRDLCQNAYDLLTKHIKNYILQIQNNLQQNANIKVDEHVCRILTLIDLLG